MAMDDDGGGSCRQARSEAGRTDRRGVLRGLAAGALAAAGGAGLIGCPARPAHAQAASDADVLNFLLNLEYLEAEFYLRAVTGQGLAAGDVTGAGTQGIVTGGGAVPFRSPAIATYAQVLAVDQQAHVRFLRAVLGGAAAAEPTIDLADSFAMVAADAGLTSGRTFSPFADDVSFLLGAYMLEDVGVTAYLGAVQSIQAKATVAAAAGLLATEAYHAGAVRSLLADIGGGAATDLISASRAAFLGIPDDVGTASDGVAFNFTDADSNAITFSRTASQVLAILYGPGGVCTRTLGILTCQPNTGGLFFPDGVNGAIG